MKTTLLIAFALIISFATSAQDKYFTRDGMISFYSSTPMEDIKAENHKVTVVMDEANGKMEFSALIKSFEFKKALMEEHFNENYMESNTYKKATFKGQIVDFDPAKVSDKPMEVVVKGSLTIHGVTKDIEEKGMISKVDGKYVLTSKLMVKPADYDIEIPGAVRDKIAESIEVTIEANLAIFKK